MTLHFPDGRSFPRPRNDPPRTWVDVRSLTDLGIEVTDLGGGDVGLCPSPERCIPVPESARHADMVDLAAVSEALDVVVADDGRHAVVRHAPAAGQAMGGTHLEVGDQLDLSLPALEGPERPVAPGHGGRGAVFAWASW